MDWNNSFCSVWCVVDHVLACRCHPATTSLSVASASCTASRTPSPAEHYPSAAWSATQKYSRSKTTRKNVTPTPGDSPEDTLMILQLADRPPEFRGTITTRWRCRNPCLVTRCAPPMRRSSKDLQTTTACRHQRQATQWHQVKQSERCSYLCGCCFCCRCCCCGCSCCGWAVVAAVVDAAVVVTVVFDDLLLWLYYIKKFYSNSFASFNNGWKTEHRRWKQRWKLIRDYRRDCG